MKHITPMKYIRSILLTALVIGITGCASTSHQSQFTATTIQQIKTGMSKDQVTAVLGDAAWTGAVLIFPFTLKPASPHWPAFYLVA